MSPVLRMYVLWYVIYDISWHAPNNIYLIYYTWWKKVNHDILYQVPGILALVGTKTKCHAAKNTVREHGWLVYIYLGDIAHGRLVYIGVFARSERPDCFDVPFCRLSGRFN